VSSSLPVVLLQTRFCEVSKGGGCENSPGSMILVMQAR